MRSDLVNAPYLAEFPMILKCRVIHTFEIGLHTQFIGEILDETSSRVAALAAGGALLAAENGLEDPTIPTEGFSTRASAPCLRPTPESNP